MDSMRELENRYDSGSELGQHNVCFSTNSSLFSPVHAAETWTTSHAAWYGWMFLAGACLPFLVSMMFMNHATFVWPWDILGGESLGLKLFFYIPCGAFLVTFFLRTFLPIRTRSVGLFLVGLGTLGGLVFSTINEPTVLLGAPFLSSPMEMKLLIVGLTLGAALIAAGNRLRKEFQLIWSARIMPAIGGVGILVLLFVPGLPSLGYESLARSLIGAAEWKMGWPVNLIIVSLLIYGVLGVVNLFRNPWRDSICGFLSFQARATLAWSPLALLLMGTGATLNINAFTDTGPVLSAIVGTFKCCAVYFGAMFLMATGLAAFFTVHIWESPVSPPGEFEEDDESAPRYQKVPEFEGTFDY